MRVKYCVVHGRMMVNGHKLRCPTCGMILQSKKDRNILLKKAYCYSCDQTVDINLVRLKSGRRMCLCPRCGGQVRGGTAKREYPIGHIAGTHHPASHSRFDAEK